MYSSASDSDSDPEGAELSITRDQREKRVTKKKKRTKRYTNQTHAETEQKNTAKPQVTTVQNSENGILFASTRSEAFCSGEQTQSESIGTECVVH